MAILRLVRPSGQKGHRPPKGRHSAALSLTDDEVLHLRAATRNAVRAYGGIDVLASVIGVPTCAIYNLTATKGHRPSGTFAIRLAQAAGMSIAAVLGHNGALTEAGRCKACGARIGHAADWRAS